MSCLRRLSIVGALIAPLTALSCGDNFTQRECGPGTTEREGQCVPDGSMICEQGTAFDMETGTCKVDPSACAMGTVFLEGECVPEDSTLTADQTEAAEPNDSTGAGQFNVPAVDASTSIHGCINPRSGAADIDLWVMNASAPSLLEITADGVGGLTAAFSIVTNEPGLDNYQRIGLNLVGDTSKRQVYLPVAGTYLLRMDDSRALLTGEAVGSEATCYYTTIKRVALPAATPLSVPSTTGQDSGNVRVLSFTPQEGNILDITQFTDSSAMSPAFVAFKNNQLVASVADDGGFTTVGGLAASDEVTLVFDAVYNYSLTPQAYELESFAIGAQALPTEGTAVTLTKQNGSNPTAPWWDPNFSYFDVAAGGQVIHFDLTSSVPVAMRILRADVFTATGALDAVATINTGAGVTAFSGEYVRFLQAGRYYFWTFDPAGTDGDTYTVTSTLTAITPTPITFDTALTAQPLPDHGAGFHSFDPATQDWIQVGVPAAANWGGNARVALYDLAGEGWLGSPSYAALRSVSQPTDGTGAFGHVTRGTTRDFLVRVEATGTPGAAATYDLLIDERPHVALGAIAAGTPINRTNMDPTAAGDLTRYLVTGSPGDRLEVTATPVEATADIFLARLDADEAWLDAVDDTGDGGAEALSAAFTTSRDWVALEVGNFGADDTNLDLALTASLPPYAATTGTLAFADACTGTGSAVLAAPFNGSADEAFSDPETLPFTLPFFGTSVTEVIVGSNGFLVMGNTEPTCPFGDACWGNDPIPAAAQPNGIIAPFWRDLDLVQVCRKTSATSVIYQWTGEVFFVGTPVRFQVVLRNTGAMDFIYGPTHAATSTTATVGIENAAGDDGVQILFNQAGVAPGTSFTLTPN